MGTWSTDIFGSDDASEVREDFRDLIADGLDADEATMQIVSRWCERMESTPEVENTFWLALARTQWDLGRLTEAVKSRAIAIITDGANLKMWGELGASEADLKSRDKTLRDLLRQLQKEPPKPKRVRKSPRLCRLWDVGDVVSCRLRSGGLCLFRVIAFYRTNELSCQVELLDWQGTEVPGEAALATIPPAVLMKAAGDPFRTEDVRRIILVFDEAKDLTDSRLEVVAHRTRIQSTDQDGATLIMWPYLDSLLEGYCRLS